MPEYVLAIDQGTTSTRAMVFDRGGRPVAAAARELPQHFPQPGWVEHDGNEIWETVAHTVPAALEQAGIDAKQLAAVGVTNQRETALLWERGSGTPVGRAVVWQDRRTADFCRERAGDGDWLHGKTGLVLDPYFSATKLRWLLERDPESRRRGEAGGVLAGTVDSFLVHRLTGGAVHATDVTNASRTLLCRIDTADWDDELCRYFGVPRPMLADVRPSAADYGVTRGLGFLPDGLPVRGVAGDQQAALFGQCAFGPGQAKCTYGTGAFFLRHTGDAPVWSKNRLLTTLAATAGPGFKYAVEGSVFVAGAAVQWLRDGLKLFKSAPDIEPLAQRSNPDEPVLFVPGFVGLGAPHWVPEARGVLFGVTRGTTAADVSRAALEGVAFQVADLIDAAAQDTGSRMTELRVDGGMARNDWFLQCQADTLGLPVLRAPVAESTALGAAFLAGLSAGVWSGKAELAGLLAGADRFEPRLPEAVRAGRSERWRRAVRAVIGFYAG